MSMNKKDKIYVGVRTDFETVYRQFVKENTVRFEAFAKIWREMKLSLIFCGQENELELLTFTDECLSIALMIFLPPNSFQRRTVGLYLLYCIYFKQPSDPKAKIRVTPTQWREVLDYMNQVAEENHHDINFVFWKLRQHQAFNFVAFPKPLAPYFNSQGEISEGSQFCLESTMLKDIIDGDDNMLETFHATYITAKKELYLNDPSLDMVQENLLTDMTQKIDNYEILRLETVDRYIENSGKARPEDKIERVKKPRRKKVKGIRGRTKKVVVEEEECIEESELEEEEQVFDEHFPTKKARMDEDDEFSDEMVIDEELLYDEPMDQGLFSMPSMRDEL